MLFSKNNKRWYLWRTSDLLFYPSNRQPLGLKRESTVVGLPNMHCPYPVWGFMDSDDTGTIWDGGLRVNGNIYPPLYQNKISWKPSFPADRKFGFIVKMLYKLWVWPFNHVPYRTCCSLDPQRLPEFINHLAELCKEPQSLPRLQKKKKKKRIHATYYSVTGMRLFHVIFSIFSPEISNVFKFSTGSSDYYRNILLENHVWKAQRWDWFQKLGLYTCTPESDREIFQR